MKNKKLLAIAGIAIASGVASSYASPYITLYQMRSALADNDADSFSSYVDFPSMRKPACATHNHDAGENGEFPEMNGNPFADLGMVMAMGFVNQAIDTMVTPAGVMTMMAGGSQACTLQRAGLSRTIGNGPTGVRRRHRAANIEQQAESRLFGRLQNWSTVTATARKGTDDEVTFILKRDGLWSWKLSAVNLPIDKFGSN